MIPEQKQQKWHEDRDRRGRAGISESDERVATPVEGLGIFEDCAQTPGTDGSKRNGH